MSTPPEKPQPFPPWSPTQPALMGRVQIVWDGGPGSRLLGACELNWPARELVHEGAGLSWRSSPEGEVNLAAAILDLVIHGQTRTVARAVPLELAQGQLYHLFAREFAFDVCRHLPVFYWHLERRQVTEWLHPRLKALGELQPAAQVLRELRRELETEGQP